MINKMTNHEILYNICKKIWYEVLYPWVNWSKFDWYNLKEYLEIWEIYFYNKFFRMYDSNFKQDNVNHIINVTEIIFTSEFMEKLVSYLDNENLLWPKRNYEKIGIEIIFNLDNPVDYIYNLIK